MFLAHLRFQGFQLHYWGGVLEVLRGKIGAEVIVTGVPGTGAIKDRAVALDAALREEVKGRDVNLLAHSMVSKPGPAFSILTQLKYAHTFSGRLGCTAFDHTLATVHLPSSIPSLPCLLLIEAVLSWRGVEPILVWAVCTPALPKALAMRPASTTSLPWSLKSPLLSLAQRQTLDRVRDEKAKTKTDPPFPGIPYSLGASLSSYLLRLLDSPAYSNLTPSFMLDAFNPTTPDRSDVRYFSVAGRSGRMGAWHPLWLPKTILDANEQTAIANGTAAPAAWRGNDGLVNVESARWGEFLGVIENCDHWQMRGGASFAAKAVQAVTPLTAARDRAVNIKPTPPTSSTATTSSSTATRGWGWFEVNELVGRWLSQRRKPSESMTSNDGAIIKDVVTEGESRSGANRLAKWIASRIPLAPAFTSSSSSSMTTVEATRRNASSRTPTSATLATSLRSRSPTTRVTPPVFFGTKARPAQAQSFDMERLYVAVCRKLYEEGL